MLIRQTDLQLTTSRMVLKIHLASCLQLLWLGLVSRLNGHWGGAYIRVLHGFRCQNILYDSRPPYNYELCRWLSTLANNLNQSRKGDVSSGAKALMQWTGGQAAVLKQGWMCSRPLPCSH